ncbi:hypothetical protein [Clostridium moutaii]
MKNSDDYRVPIIYAKLKLLYKGMVVMGGFRGAKIMALPYWSFKEKIRIVKKHEKYYHIEDFGRDGLTGILYMERKRDVSV